MIVADQQRCGKKEMSRESGRKEHHMNSNRKRIIKENEISDIYTFTLGGYSQKVLIEGRRKDLPVVVTLHGGPGMPMPFSVGSRGMFPEFTNRFIMVYWDQLGCGINDYVIDDHFSADSFADMTVDLIREVKALFPDNGIYIFATSWGSILSAKAAGRLNGILDGVIVWGQMVKKPFLNEEVYAALDRSELPKEKLEQVKSVEIDSAAPKDMRFVCSCIQKYTEGYQNHNSHMLPMLKMSREFLTSPDYRFKDFKALMINGCLNNMSLWRDMVGVDLASELSGVQVPYFIIQGDTDIVTSTAEVKKLAESSGNPLLQYCIVDNSSHSFMTTEGMETVLRVLIERTRTKA